jgi:glyoxylate reductase
MYNKKGGRAMKKVLVTREIPRAAIELLEKHFEVKLNPEDRPMTKEELYRDAKQCDAVLTQLTDKIDGEFFDECPNIKICANYAVGYDNFDVIAAKDRNVVLTNTPDVLSETTAELAWALLMSVSRRIVEADNYLRDGNWKQFKPTLLLGQDLYGKTLGILGAGRIGKAFVKKSLGYDMDVIYHNRSRDELFEKKYGARWVSKQELYEKSDVLSIHVPLTKETYHMVDKQAFKEMKPNTILINTSRGSVVDQEALINALENKLIWGAGLDVFEEEPMVPKKLLAMEQVVLTPHIGSASRETRTDMGILAARNIIEVLEGREPLTQVTK